MRSIISAIDPRIDEHVWQFRRWQSVQQESKHLQPLTRKLTVTPRGNSPIHAVVVLPGDPKHRSYQIAGQNHFFEIQQSLREIHGNHAVSVMAVGADEPARDWHGRLLQTLIDTQATHLITQIETDPNQPDEWSWDVIADALSKGWQGTWVGVMWDAAFPWLRIKARRLGRIYENLLITDFCQPMTGTARRGRLEAGPVTMPLSQATVDAITSETADVAKKYDVTFIGALYDYRVQLLSELSSMGINVVTNPHRADAPTTFDESRANQPTYLEYMRGLAASETTINFSLASGGPTQQYKIRIQEAAMVGCLPLTDDRSRTELFFREDEYAYFQSIPDLDHILESLLSNRQRLQEMQKAARSRALDLATIDFWGRVSDAARHRRLLAPTPLSAPSKL